jgi:hypothetical protein
VTLGCYVPLQLVVNGNASNTVTMAINNGHKPCSDTSPFSSTSRSGGKNASIALARLSYTDPLNALKIGNGTIDIAMGTFNQSSGTGDLGFSLFASLPPINTCTYYNNVGGLNGLLGGQMPDSSNGATPLDAGSAITVKGPNGTQGVSYSDSSAKASPYLGVLGTGGGWSALGLGPSTPFLDPGTYMVSGLGGKDVGPFQYTLQIPGGATWTNRDSITTVERRQPVDPGRGHRRLLEQPGHQRVGSVCLSVRHGAAELHGAVQFPGQPAGHADIQPGERDLGAGVHDRAYGRSVRLIQHQCGALPG